MYINWGALDHASRAPLSVHVYTYTLYMYEIVFVWGSVGAEVPTEIVGESVCVRACAVNHRTTIQCSPQHT